MKYSCFKNILMILIYSANIISLNGAPCAGRAPYDAKLAQNKTNIIEIAVFGEGPAGLAAGIYGARGGYNTIIFQGPKPGGQLMDATVVENWPAVDSGPGAAHIKKMENQAKKFGAQIVPETIENIDVNSWPFAIKTDKNFYHALSIVLAMGANSKKLNIPGETQYFGKHILTCVICDAPLTKDQDVIVIGGGDAAIERTLQVAKHAKSVTILVRGNKMRAAKRNQRKLKQFSNIKVLYNKVAQEFVGDSNRVTDVLVKDINSGNTEKLKTDWVVLSVGWDPNTQIVKNKLVLTKNNYVWHKPGSRETSIHGIFCAGNVCDFIYRQAGTAAGDGSKAALNAISFLNKMGFDSYAKKYITHSQFNAKKRTCISPKNSKMGVTTVPIITTEKDLTEHLNSDKPVLIEFYAEYCPTCKGLEPVINKYYQDLGDKNCFFKIEVTKAKTLAKKFNITALPTFILFRDSKEIMRNSEISDQKQFTEFIQKINAPV